MLSLNEYKVTLIGCGKMGQALAQGWLNAGCTTAHMRVVDPNPTAWRKLEQQGVVPCSLSKALRPPVDAVVLAVKPNQVDAVLLDMRRVYPRNAVLISIAAGVPIAHYQNALGDVPIVRAMPNTPAEIGCAATAVVGNAYVDGQAWHCVQALFSAVGLVVKVANENNMHAVTALSGSGPAYVFAFLDGLIQAAQKQGLDEGIARALAVHTVLGAAQLAKCKQGVPLSELRTNVTSPNGTTAAALAELLQTGDNGLQALLHRTLTAAHKRSIELSAQGESGT